MLEFRKSSDFSVRERLREFATQMFRCAENIAENLLLLQQ
jgi:hypothetical protein